MSDEAKIDWEINLIRESIRHDWAMLASKELTADDRRGIREHLLINVSALQELVKRNRSASQKWKIEKFTKLRRSIEGREMKSN